MMIVEREVSCGARGVALEAIYIYITSPRRDFATSAKAEGDIYKYVCRRGTNFSVK